MHKDVRAACASVDFESDIDIRRRQIIASLLRPFDQADAIPAEVIRETRFAPFVAVPESIKIKVV